LSYRTNQTLLVHTWSLLEAKISELTQHLVLWKREEAMATLDEVLALVGQLGPLITNVSNDYEALMAQIGQLSPEDQAKLDQIAQQLGAHIGQLGQVEQQFPAAPTPPSP